MGRLTKQEKRNALSVIGKLIRSVVHDGWLDHYSLTQRERDFAEEWCEELSDQLTRSNGHA